MPVLPILFWTIVQMSHYCSMKKIVVVDTVPIIFGNSGIASVDQQTYLKRIPGCNENLFNNLQKSAILGTINILRSVNIGCT